MKEVIISIPESYGYCLIPSSSRVISFLSSLFALRWRNGVCVTSYLPMPNLVSKHSSCITMATVKLLSTYNFGTTWN